MSDKDRIKGSTIKIEAELLEFKRLRLGDRLLKLYPEQLAFLNRIYPGTVPDDNLISAIDLCDRTIRKNEAGRLPAPTTAEGEQGK